MSLRVLGEIRRESPKTGKMMRCVIRLAILAAPLREKEFGEKQIAESFPPALRYRQRVPARNGEIARITSVGAAHAP